MVFIRSRPVRRSRFRPEQFVDPQVDGSLTEKSDQVNAETLALLVEP